MMFGSNQPFEPKRGLSLGLQNNEEYKAPME
jgi:hypothetical protein